MPRQRRNLQNANWAHIILRGINRQNIFYDETDYNRFFSTFFRYQRQCGFEFGIICLMSNHVHMLIGSENASFADIMRKLTVSYAMYFNRKYDRVGYVFQDRYRSEPVNDERALLATCRYIYQNPPKAGLGPAESYPYTVFNRNGIVRRCFNSNEEMFAFMNVDDGTHCLDYDTPSRLTDADALELLFRLTGSDNPHFLQNADKELRNRVLRDLKAHGISIRRLSRLTGISRNIIQRVPNESKAPSP